MLSLMLKSLEPRARLSLVTLLFLVAVVTAGCDAGGGEVTTTTVPLVTTTVATTTVAPTTTTTTLVDAILSESIPGETSASIDADLDAAIRAEIGELILFTEEIRDLPFLTIPTVTILDEADFTARVRDIMEEELDPVELANDQAVFQLLGMLDDSIDLHDFFIELWTEQVAGFYDPDEREIVVPVSPDGVTPLQRAIIVDELIHALTDQHFDFGATIEELIDDGYSDEAMAFTVLVQGDSLFHFSMYMAAMDPNDAVAAMEEAMAADSTLLESAPFWIQQNLIFPYMQGLTFFGFLLDDGGLGSVDAAYLDPPISTEQVIHPEKFALDEQPTELAPLTAVLDGWEVLEEGTLGEWGVHLLLVGSVSLEEVTQAAAGWGNDRYTSFIQGDDAAFAWVYSGDSVLDAEELFDALILHIDVSMDAGEPQDSDGGFLFDEGETYVFIERVDEKIYFVASTAPDARDSLRQQLGA